MTDGEFVFWHSYGFDIDAGTLETCTLKKVAKGGGPVKELMTTDLAAICLAVDDTHVYWTEWPRLYAVFESGWIKRTTK